jgi:hypothetical protein
MSRAYKLACGCLVDAETDRLKQFCSGCGTEYQARHAQAQIDHQNSTSCAGLEAPAHLVGDSNTAAGTDSLQENGELFL